MADIAVTVHTGESSAAGPSPAAEGSVAINVGIELPTTHHDPAPAAAAPPTTGEATPANTNDAPKEGEVHKEVISPSPFTIHMSYLTWFVNDD
jgi:hypothetical protein